MSSILAFVVVSFSLGLSGCGSEDEDNSACVSDYGFVVDGDSCNENSNSMTECPIVSCLCENIREGSFICFNGTCVTGIENCEAWCNASQSDRFACF